MRTTLDIADDVLLVAKDLARREKKSAGQVLSELARKGLAHREGLERAPGTEPEEEFLGFRPFGRRGGVVTNELVNRIREELGE
jgi:hypothetical protein